MKYFVSWGKKELGPLDHSVIRAMLEKGQLDKKCLISADRASWVPVKDSGLFPGIHFDQPGKSSDASTTKQSSNSVEAQDVLRSDSASPKALCHLRQTINANLLKGACGLLLILALGSLIYFFICSTSTPKAEELLKTDVENYFKAKKQVIFDKFHPVGKATSARVNDIKILSWENEKITNKVADVKEFSAIFVIGWEGPITKDGYTQFEAIYNYETQHWSNLKILKTNGYTNQDLVDVGVDAFLKVLPALL